MSSSEKKGNHEKFPTKPDGTRDLYERTHVATYQDMEKLLDSGKVKAIGVANYSLRYLNELLSQTSVIPAVNQIENHLLLPQQEIVDFCKERGIHVTAYSPLGSSGSPLLQLPVVQRIAHRKGVSTAAVLLSWHGTVSFFCSLC
jgi:glycerol 2-dehydrogenase (NADP+)